MNRTTLLEQLRGYRTGWQEEQKMVGKMVNFLEREPNAFFRTCPEGHMTASALITNTNRSEVLLLHHAKLNRWLQPGGHADGVENLYEVALKEAHEETGLRQLSFLTESIFDIDIHAIPARKTEPKHWHYDVRFLLRANMDEQLRQNEESNALQWVPVVEISKYTQEPSILRMLQKLNEIA